MKITLTVLFIILIHCKSVFSQILTSDDFKLKGKVKNLKEETFNIPDANSSKLGKMQELKLLEFNRKKYLLSNNYNMFSTYGDFGSKEVFVFDENSLPKHKENYDKDGLLTSVSYFIFGVKNNLDKTYTLDGNKDTISLKYFEYDPNTKLVQEIEKKPSVANPYFKIEYKYDSLGRKYSEMGFDSSGNLTKELKFLFLNNQIEKTIIIDLFGSKINQKQIFNENNQLLEDISFDEKGNVVTKINYKYDDFGNEIESEFFDFIEKVVPELITYKKQYKYDNNNNWIESINITTLKPGDVMRSLTKREIIYYKD